MSMVAILEFRCKDDTYEGLKSTMSKILADTAAFEGCETVHAASDDATKTVWLYEVWDKPESQKKYIGWRGERGDLDPLMAALREPLQMRTMDVLSF